MDAFLLSTAVVFVAELGDKSQLMAMTFAATSSPSSGAARMFVLFGLVLVADGVRALF